MSEWIEEWFESYQSGAKRVLAGYDRLKDLDLVVVDNSIRESTVGQLRGHTSDDKCKIFQEATKCGFKVCIRLVVFAAMSFDCAKKNWLK